MRMPLSDLQKARPHAIARRNHPQTILERSFAQNRSDEIAWWVQSGVVEQTLVDPKRQHGLHKALLHGVYVGLDPAWLLRLPKTYAFTIGQWAAEWAKSMNWSDRPTALPVLDICVDTLKANPFTDHPPQSSSIWNEVLYWVSRNQNNPSAPDAIERMDRWMTQWSSNKKAYGADLSRTMVAIVVEQDNAHTPELSSFLTRWRDHLLAVGAPNLCVDAALERLLDDVCADPPTPASDPKWSWCRVLAPHATHVSLRRAAQLCHSDEGAHVLELARQAGAVPVWGTTEGAMDDSRKYSIVHHLGEVRSDVGVSAPLKRCMRFLVSHAQSAGPTTPDNRWVSVAVAEVLNHFFPIHCVPDNKRAYHCAALVDHLNDWARLSPPPSDPRHTNAMQHIIWRAREAGSMSDQIRGAQELGDAIAAHPTCSRTLIGCHPPHLDPSGALFWSGFVKNRSVELTWPLIDMMLSLGASPEGLAVLAPLWKTTEDIDQLVARGADPKMLPEYNDNSKVKSHMSVLRSAAQSAAALKEAVPSDHKPNAQRLKM